MQLVASLLVDMMDDLDLYESQAVGFEELLNEMQIANPRLILLEETLPFSSASLMTRLLAARPELPVIVISEDTNLIHVIRCQTRLLSSSKDLIETIQTALDPHSNQIKENAIDEKYRPPT
jgi:DNA-binding NarL/FixJ family response regulator